MAWNWIADLFSPDNKKKYYWDVRCPYMLCPSNWPPADSDVEKKKPRLKFVQKISFFVHQYRCKDCGNLINFSVEQADDIKQSRREMNPALIGKADYRFYV